MTGCAPAGRRAVVVSPHLDDAVFSAGGTIARLSDIGWRVRVVTCFTASMPTSTPFALSTQTDKGLPADVDYLAVRRAEDTAALQVLGAQARHLDFPEAPHRGYDSAPELFAGIRADDVIARPLGAALATECADADLVLGPQAIGGHVDHQVTLLAMLGAGFAAPVAWWRDAPYAQRNPHARPHPEVPTGSEQAVDITATMSRKTEAACCYATQLGFQFGGREQVADALRHFAAAEGRASGGYAPLAERFTGSLPEVGAP